MKINRKTRDFIADMLAQGHNVEVLEETVLDDDGSKHIERRLSVTPRKPGGLDTLAYRIPKEWAGPGKGWIEPMKADQPIPLLKPGEPLSLIGLSHGDFRKYFLREISNALGIPYDKMKAEWSPKSKHEDDAMDLAEDTEPEAGKEPDAIAWGPAIEVNGKRPKWLSDDDIGLLENRPGGWLGGADRKLSYYGWSHNHPFRRDEIQCPISIRLPADHFAYKALYEGMEPWGGGEEAPEDWFTRTEVLLRAGVIGSGQRWTHTPEEQPSVRAADIIGYHRMPGADPATATRLRLPEQ